MGKTFRRNQSFRPKGRDFKKFQKSNKWKKWNDKPHHILKESEEQDVQNEE